MVMHSMTFVMDMRSSHTALDKFKAPECLYGRGKDAGRGLSCPHIVDSFVEMTSWPPYDYFPTTELKLD